MTLPSPLSPVLPCCAALPLPRREAAVLPCRCRAAAALPCCWYAAVRRPPAVPPPRRVRAPPSSPPTLLPCLSACAGDESVYILASSFSRPLVLLYSYTLVLLFVCSLVRLLLFWQLSVAVASSLFWFVTNVYCQLLSLSSSEDFWTLPLRYYFCVNKPCIYRLLVTCCVEAVRRLLDSETSGGPRRVFAAFDIILENLF